MNNIEQLKLFTKNIKSLISDLEKEAQDLYIGYAFINVNGRICEIIEIYYDHDYGDLRATLKSSSFTFTKSLYTIPGIK